MVVVAVAVEVSVVVNMSTAKTSCSGLLTCLILTGRGGGRGGFGGGGFNQGPPAEVVRKY